MSTGGGLSECSPHRATGQNFLLNGCPSDGRAGICHARPYEDGSEDLLCRSDDLQEFNLEHQCCSGLDRGGRAFVAIGDR